MMWYEISKGIEYTKSLTKTETWRRVVSAKGHSLLDNEEIRVEEVGCPDERGRAREAGRKRADESPYQPLPLLIPAPS